jgi:EAL domain-containing protein (putative c-di-GMP-specific phosphodiesterase class I)
MSRILVVDDEPQMCRLIELSLHTAGHQVIRAASGQEALQTAARRCFDIAVVDYGMEPLDGLAMLDRLHAVQPACMGILMSGHLDLHVVIQAVNRGVVARVLTKPFDVRELVAAVDEVQSRRRELATAAARAETGGEEQRGLNECIEGDFLRLAVQPIVAAGDGRVVAYEALMRSSHPLLRGPLDILRAAEKYGMLHALSSVLADAAEKLAAALPPGPQLFMNLHPSELADPGNLAQRIAGLRRFAGRMVLEITERSHVLDFAAWRESTALLRDAGFSIAVDDLGAGYSSLSVLAELKPQYIKVDMSIVRDIHRDGHKHRLAELLCGFASTTGATLVAEGVETEDEARILRACGAHLLQGYLFGHPSIEVASSFTAIPAPAAIRNR